MKLLIATAAVCAVLTGAPWGRSRARLSPDRAGAQSVPLDPPSRPSLVSARLQALALRAENRSTWSAVRHYAETARNPEERGLTYFVLGYREEEAGEFPAAEADLARSVETRCSLADFAAYYEAEAAAEADEPERAAEILRAFGTRYPESVLRLEALETFARASLDANRPEPVLAALAAEPETRQRPSLEMLLAGAYEKAGKLLQAARAFEDVYYRLPTSPASADAGAALRRLSARLGPIFPSPSDETRTGRAKILLDGGHYGAAADEYGALIKSTPFSPLAYTWTLGRARSLLALKRYHDAEEVLAGSPWPDPESDAERQELLMDAYARLDDQASMLGTLDALRKSHPKSRYCARALDLAGYFFVRQQDWAAAKRYYQTLIEEFPDDPQAREASWRIAWADYLASDYPEARQAFVTYLNRFADSPEASAALYWLGRISEEDGSISVARGLYVFITKRFGSNYYAGRAADRLKALRSARRPHAQQPLPGSARGGSAAQPTMASLVAQLAPRIRPAPAPPRAVCPRLRADDDLRPFLILKQLNLGDLALRYVKGLLARKPGDPEALVALGRTQAEQKSYSDSLFTIRELVPYYPRCETRQLPRDIWDMLYPRAYWSLVRRYARANRLDPYLVMALIRQESAFDARATSAANARGLMQMRPQTAQLELRSRGRRVRRRRLRPTPRTVARELYNPAYNLRLSCHFLRTLLDTFNGNMVEALAAYNAGDNRVNEWLSRGRFSEPAAFVQSIPFVDTRTYVESVLRDAVIYRRLISGTARFKKCP